MSSNENSKEHASQLNRQTWEPAGVVSVIDDNTVPKYETKSRKDAKGGKLTLEVEEVFHNKGIMNGVQGD
jgi:hypothetical protein